MLGKIRKIIKVDDLWYGGEISILRNRKALLNAIENGSVVGFAVITDTQSICVVLEKYNSNLKCKMLSEVEKHSFEGVELKGIDFDKTVIDNKKTQFVSFYTEIGLLEFCIQSAKEEREFDYNIMVFKDDRVGDDVLIINFFAK